MANIFLAKIGNSGRGSWRVKLESNIVVDIEKDFFPP